MKSYFHQRTKDERNMKNKTKIESKFEFETTERQAKEWLETIIFFFCILLKPLRKAIFLRLIIYIISNCNPLIHCDSVRNHGKMDQI